MGNVLKWVLALHPLGLGCKMRLKCPRPPTPKCAQCRRTLLPGNVIPVSIEFIAEAREGYHKIPKEKPHDPEPAWARNKDVCPKCWESIKTKLAAAKEREAQRFKAKKATKWENQNLAHYRNISDIPWRIWKKAPKATRLGWMNLHARRCAARPLLRFGPNPKIVEHLQANLQQRNLAPLLVAWARHPRVLNRYWAIGRELAKKLVRRIQTKLEFLTREEEDLLAQYWGPHIRELNGLVWIPIRRLDIGLGSAYAKGPL